MIARLDPRQWPLTLKVPLAVAALMVLVGLILSERVLSRLGETQERQLRALVQTYLDGLSSAVAPAILRDDVWETYDAIVRAQALNKSLHPRSTVITDAEGLVIAAADPRRFPVGARLPSDLAFVATGRDFSFEAGARVATATRILSYPGRIVGIIHATFDTSHLAAERRDIVLTLVATNGILTLVLASAGWFLVARMMAPVRTLSRHLGAASAGRATPVPSDALARNGAEFARLFHAYNALVASMDEREDLARQLADEHRLGSLGRLASALAHEINNPLGGLVNAVATLQAHGHQAAVRKSSLGLIERGLVGIRDVVRTTLALYRPEHAPRDFTMADFDDLRLLATPQARRKGVTLKVSNDVKASLPLPSTQVRQAVLNLLLNAVAAAPTGSEVVVEASIEPRELHVIVSDQGCGLPEPAARLLASSEASAGPPWGGGLGLWTTRRILDDLGASAVAERPAAGGTRIRLLFPFDRTPEMAHVA